ncbi:MAG: hypothetical protein KDE51_11600 [Anaerolineales bacterium]|nr:hypothetical protein [Anaerolineales bacterium]
MRQIACLICFMLLVTACGPTAEETAATVESQVALAAVQTIESLPPATNQPTYTPAPTLTALPTLTIIPTQTANPTYTPLPTYTPFPTYTPPPTETAVPTVNAANSTQSVAAPSSGSSGYTFDAQMVLLTRSQMTNILVAFSGVDHHQVIKQTMFGPVPGTSEVQGPPKCSEALNYNRQLLDLKVASPDETNQQLRDLYNQYEATKNNFQNLINNALNACQTAVSNGQTLETLADYPVIEMQSRDIFAAINGLIDTLRNLES